MCLNFSYLGCVFQKKKFSDIMNAYVQQMLLMMMMMICFHEVDYHYLKWMEMLTLSVPPAKKRKQLSKDSKIVLGKKNWEYTSMKLLISIPVVRYSEVICFFFPILLLQSPR